MLPYPLYVVVPTELDEARMALENTVGCEAASRANGQTLQAIATARSNVTSHHLKQLIRLVCIAVPLTILHLAAMVSTSEVKLQNYATAPNSYGHLVWQPKIGPHSPIFTYTMIGQVVVMMGGLVTLDCIKTRREKSAIQNIATQAGLTR